MWGESWGTMVWGSASTPVPVLGSWGLLLLAGALAAVAALKVSKRRGTRVSLLLLVAVAMPLSVRAGTVDGLATFTNGQTADANEVNGNFNSVKTAVDDNDGRVTTAQGTADTNTIDILALQSAGSPTGFEACANGLTVADHDTGLLWEKKTDDSTLHDKDNAYNWSTGTNNPDGTAFTVFLASLNDTTQWHSKPGGAV